MRTLFVASVVCVFLLLILAACGGGSKNQSSASMGTVDLTLSDPSTCSAPQGPYSHIYVTITDVKASTNANAGDNDPSFVDLTPGLGGNPQQVDLLGVANNQCFLATLGSKVQLQPGNYQQIRMILLDNGSASKVTGNKCGSAANCVVLASDNSVHALQLSSESQTGIKIPSGQIAGGQFTIAAGQTKDLNLDFDACASVVVQSNGQYRLKPVLHAGEVSTTSTSINGKIVDQATNQPISGGKIVVAVEQMDASGIDRVIMETVPDSQGNFVFCPLLAGTYDVVAVAVNSSNVAYAAQIVTGVQPGSALGTIALTAQTGTSTAPASITGQITSATSGNTGIAIDSSVSALQQITSGSSSLLVTIPLATQSSATATLTTQSGAACPANTDCASYTFQLPAVNPFVGAFSASGTKFLQTPGNASYTVDALAFVVSSGGTVDCTPSEQKTASPVAVTAGTPANAPVLAFTSCQ